MVRFYVVLLYALILGCGFTDKKENKLALSNLNPKETIVDNAMRIPVYNYDGLEPLLQKKDEKTYIINFWATWCAPCIKELPYFEKINAEQKDNNVVVILVSLDMPSMWKSNLLPFIKKKNLRSHVIVLDDPKQNTWIPKVDENWSGGIPATLIYNKDKRIFYERPFTYVELNEQLNKFVNK